MSQSHLLIDTLKGYLKLKNIKYRDLAKRLGQTEANVKRIFSKKSLSLAQLESICAIAGTDIFELAKISSSNKVEAGCFTAAQETVLAANVKLFAFFYLLISFENVKKIQDKYAFTDRECTSFLIQLDKIGLIRLLPENRFQLLVSKNIHWLENGPLNTKYRANIKSEFMDSRFDGQNERLRFLYLPMSEETLNVFTRKLDKLIGEFTKMVELDSPSNSKETIPMWLLLAHRPWSFSQLSSLKRLRK